MINTVLRVSKAAAAALAAFASTLGLALADGSIDTGEWVTVAVTTVVTAVTTFSAPANRPKADPAPDGAQ
jgi:hypothetical protein